VSGRCERREDRGAPRKRSGEQAVESGRRLCVCCCCCLRSVEDTNAQPKPANLPLLLTLPLPMCCLCPQKQATLLAQLCRCCAGRKVRATLVQSLQSLMAPRVLSDGALHPAQRQSPCSKSRSAQKAVSRPETATGRGTVAVEGIRPVAGSATGKEAWSCPVTMTLPARQAVPENPAQTLAEMAEAVALKLILERKVQQGIPAPTSAPRCCHAERGLFQGPVRQPSKAWGG